MRRQRRRSRQMGNDLARPAGKPRGALSSPLSLLGSAGADPVSQIPSVNSPTSNEVPFKGRSSAAFPSFLGHLPFQIQVISRTSPTLYPGDLGLSGITPELPLGGDPWLLAREYGNFFSLLTSSAFLYFVFQLKLFINLFSF